VFDRAYFSECLSQSNDFVLNSGALTAGTERNLTSTRAKEKAED
jgi:hypothetical protein